MFVGSPIVYRNGVKEKLGQTANTRPEISAEYVLVPFRFVAEALGAKIIWNHDTQSAAVLLNDKKIVIRMKSNGVSSDGTTYDKIPAMKIVGGTTFIPTSLFTDFFEVPISYDEGLIIIGNSQTEMATAQNHREEFVQNIHFKVVNNGWTTVFGSDQATPAVKFAENLPEAQVFNPSDEAIWTAPKRYKVWQGKKYVRDFHTYKEAYQFADQYKDSSIYLDQAAKKISILMILLGRIKK